MKRHTTSSALFTHRLFMKRNTNLINAEAMVLDTKKEIAEELNRLPYIDMDKCQYCGSNTNDFININKYWEYSGVEICINRQGMLRLRTYQNDDTVFDLQDIININYCPICGKKFKK